MWESGKRVPSLGFVTSSYEIRQLYYIGLVPQKLPHPITSELPHITPSFLGRVLIPYPSATKRLQTKNARPNGLRT